MRKTRSQEGENGTVHNTRPEEEAEGSIPFNI